MLKFVHHVSCSNGQDLFVITEMTKRWWNKYNEKKKQQMYYMPRDKKQMEAAQGTDDVILLLGYYDKVEAPHTVWDPLIVIQEIHKAGYNVLQAIRYINSTNNISFNEACIVKLMAKQMILEWQS